MPWMCRSPKNEPFQPEKGKNAMGAGTPTFIPTMPALTRFLNVLAALPSPVNRTAAFPKPLRLQASMPWSRLSVRTTERTGPKISSRTIFILVSASSKIVGPR